MVMAIDVSSSKRKRSVAQNSLQNVFGHDVDVESRGFHVKK